MVTPVVDLLVSDSDDHLGLLPVYSNNNNNPAAGSDDSESSANNSKTTTRERLNSNNSKRQKSVSDSTAQTLLSTESDIPATGKMDIKSKGSDLKPATIKEAVTAKMEAQTTVLTEASATSTEDNEQMDDDHEVVIGDHGEQQQKQLSPQAQTPQHEMSTISDDNNGNDDENEQQQQTAPQHEMTATLNDKDDPVGDNDDDENGTANAASKEGVAEAADVNPGTLQVDVDSLEASTAENAAPDIAAPSTSSTGSPPKYYRLNAFDHYREESSSLPDEDMRTAALGEDAPTTCTPNDQASLSKATPRNVRFKDVEIREYDITIGDNPYCSYGVPICLDWGYSDTEAIPIDFFEASQKRRRNARRMLLNSFQRRDMLWRAGHELEDIEKAIKATEKEKFRRSMTLYFLPIFQIQELFYLGAEKVFGGDEKKEPLQSCEEQVRQLHETQLAVVEPEVGGLAPWQQEQKANARSPPKLERRVSFRGSGSSPSVNVPANASVQSEAEFSTRSMDSSLPDEQYQGARNSKFKRYAVKVDHHQHDKSTEIVLCNLQRPHMRAFHAAWFGFFVAFVGWFAITPLLSEVKDTLKLTRSQIWTSSLCGTASTIVVRIMMGPLCDKFGARLCMAFILASSAVPVALTGLVRTSAGLSTIRTFIGIAGSSFVACQYWTSQMFTREVAGTANALVAGWGNLGGGFTQILMGSALFPLFQLFFLAEDYDGDTVTSSEMAWRTVFVVPAVLMLSVAYVVWWHCDDSPKGDYRERVRQEQILVVSPFASLCHAAKNWNVWVLLFQYACCFGVEVTMTNATALYFTEQFGQTTVSAAAIASTFGAMNLFARGFGGFGSDLCNSKFGIKGRLGWQIATLFMEGCAVILFGFAGTLAGSICALIFLSIMVQSAEGSTFGIVPYVDKRFTGAVVGFVGAGGNIGGVIFAVLFREFSYRTAFTLMGAFACASSFSSLLMNVKSLAQIHAEHEENEKKNDAFNVTEAAAETFAKEEF